MINLLNAGRSKPAKLNVKRRQNTSVLTTANEHIISTLKSLDANIRTKSIKSRSNLNRRTLNNFQETSQNVIKNKIDVKGEENLEKKLNSHHKIII